MADPQSQEADRWPPGAGERGRTGSDYGDAAASWGDTNDLKPDSGDAAQPCRYTAVGHIARVMPLCVRIASQQSGYSVSLTFYNAIIFRVRRYYFTAENINLEYMRNFF